VKRTIFLATLFAVALVILLAGCGDPAIGKLESITLTAVTSNKTVEVKGEGGTLQLVATGNYNTRATKDLTAHVTYTATAYGCSEGSAVGMCGPELPATSATNPQTISISATGLVTAIPPFFCTFTNEGTPTTPAWVLTGSYGIVATFDNITSNPVYVPVAAAAGMTTADAGACGP